VRVYDHALTATEIQTDMQRPVSSGAGPAPAGTAPPAGIVAAYNFDEASGDTVNDSSGLGNNGTATGGPLRVAGHTGGSLSFDGVDDVVTVPGTASLALANGMTIEAWVKPTELGGLWRTVALKEQSGDLCYALYAHDGAGAAGHVFVGSEWRARGGALTLNAWTHLAATYDGSVLALYRDGALVTTTLVSGQIATSSGPLVISFEALATYHGREARLWERQALVSARGLKWIGPRSAANRSRSGRQSPSSPSSGPECRRSKPGSGPNSVATAERPATSAAAHQHSRRARSALATASVAKTPVSNIASATPATGASCTARAMPTAPAAAGRSGALRTGVIGS